MKNPCNLESLHQIIGALDNRFKNNDENRILVYEYVIVDNLNELEPLDKGLYYGIMTVGSDTVARLKMSNVEVIKIIENNQIIEYFDSVEYLNNSEQVNNAPLGHFRGWKIMY